MTESIKLFNVCENNLKNINVEIPYHKHTVIVGVSGSGKSTLAYDSIYATAQRKLLDCMAEQEQRFSMKMKKPKVGRIEGLSTVISLKQVKPNQNPRSTIGTYTSIGSYIRNIMAIHGECKCLYCNETYKQSNLGRLVKDIEMLDNSTIVEVSFVYFFDRKTTKKQQIDELRQKGYRYIYVDQERRNLRDFVEIGDDVEFILVVESRFQAADKLRRSDINILKSASEHGDDFICIQLSGEDQKGITRFYQKHGCPDHHMITMTLDASAFSYNNMACVCPECKGSGMKKVVHPSKVIKNSKKSLEQGPFFTEVYSLKYPYNYMMMYSLSRHYQFAFDTPYEDLPEKIKEIIMYGSNGKTFPLLRPEGYDKSIPNYRGEIGDMVEFEGVLKHVESMYDWAQSSELTQEQIDFFNTYMHEIVCPDCQGTRLKKIKKYITLNGKTYFDLGSMELVELRDFLKKVKGNDMSEQIIEALIERLDIMIEIGLGYLVFERRIDSLSGGEYQRLRIANQVGSGLIGLTYIIDEPTDGLHGTDNQKVIQIIKKLVEKGNTVITIEHNFNVIHAADYIIEMGPRAGVNGGQVIACGSISEIQNNSNSIIGK